MLPWDRGFFEVFRKRLNNTQAYCREFFHWLGDLIGQFIISNFEHMIYESYIADKIVEWKLNHISRNLKEYWDVKDMYYGYHIVCKGSFPHPSIHPSNYWRHMQGTVLDARYTQINRTHFCHQLSEMKAYKNIMVY